MYTASPDEWSTHQAAAEAGVPGLTASVAGWACDPVQTADEAYAELVATVREELDRDPTTPDNDAGVLNVSRMVLEELAPGVEPAALSEAERNVADTLAAS